VDPQTAATRAGIGVSLELGIPEPDFLERAAEAVVEEHPAEPLLSPDQDMLREAVAEVVETVRDALAGHEPVPPEHTQVDRRLLLRSLRGAVLEDWSDEDGSLLETMRAFEVAARALGGDDGDLGASPFSRSLLREVVHLLLSPLGSVVMLAGRLLDERVGPLNDDQQRQLRIIHRAATTAATATSDILTLTSPDEHYGARQRFSVKNTVAIVADVVRPVTEARGSELVVREQVERPRLGPTKGLTQALLGLATRVALMTREGTVELDVVGTEGDTVSFSLTGRGAQAATSHEDDPFLMFRTGPGSEGYTLSPEALAFSAGRRSLRAMGSELEVGLTDDGALRLHFEMMLPVAD
jgi:signal transduction histidine kinase